MLDPELAKEIRKEANGNGSREAKFSFLARIRACSKAMSSPDILYDFDDILTKHGRVCVAVCVAASLQDRDFLDSDERAWALAVLNCWHNAPRDKQGEAHYNDGLDLTRILEYAGPFVRLTTI